MWEFLESNIELSYFTHHIPAGRLLAPLAVLNPAE